MTALALHSIDAMPRPRLYDGRQTAAAVGLSLDRFRKVRRDWTRERDFPAEVNEPGEPIRYLAEAVDRWVERRSRRVHVVADPADRAEPVAARPAQAGRLGRASLRAIRGEASL